MSAFHSFSTAAAREVGVNAAVLLHHIAIWCESNRANGRNFKDGRYWTYNSYAAFEKLFPYLTYKQIRTALGVLEKEGLIVSASYNEQRYDKTKWYRPTDKGLLLEHMDPEQDETPEDDGTDCPTGQTPYAPQGRPVCPTGQTPYAPQGRPIPSKNNIQVGTNKRDSGSQDEQEVESPQKRKRKAFVKPTVEEVAEYAASIGKTIDAERFVDFYESKGWMVGKNEMKDWKAAVRNWIGRDKAAQKPADSSQYGQYSFRRKAASC